MARIFFAYDSRDRELARALESGLKEKGHESVWGVDELIAGRGWGELMPRRLASADAVVAILTPNSQNSSSMWCEIGAARALANTERRTALLPIVIGLDKTPGYTEDMLVLWAKKSEPANDARLISEIDTAIRAHLATIEAREASPRIFVSHRQKDQAIAAALTETIRAAFDVRPTEIRCTSVQPYRLPFGKNTGDRLRDEVGRAQVVLGILSPDTSQSSYVMFELGAAWAQRVYTCPLLSKGAEYQHIPGPIFDLAPARLWDPSDCYQLLGNLETELNLTRSKDTQGAVSDKITALTKAAAGD
jgi:TIR domain